MNAGADFYDRDNIMDATAFELALKGGHIEVAKMIIREADVTRLIGEPSQVGYTPFGRLIFRAYDVRR